MLVDTQWSELCRAWPNVHAPVLSKMFRELRDFGTTVHHHWSTQQWKGAVAQSLKWNKGKGFQAVKY